MSTTPLRVVGSSVVRAQGHSGPPPYLEPAPPMSWPADADDGDFVTLALWGGKTVSIEPINEQGAAAPPVHWYCVQFDKYEDLPFTYFTVWYAWLPDGWRAGGGPFTRVEGHIGGSFFAFLYDLGALTVYRNVKSVDQIRVTAGAPGAVGGETPTPEATTPDPVIYSPGRPYSDFHNPPDPRPFPFVWEDRVSDAAITMLWALTTFTDVASGGDQTGVWTNQGSARATRALASNMYYDGGGPTALPPALVQIIGLNPTWGFVTWAVTMKGQPATRQYPRDTLGLAAGTRIYPPPRTGRVAGGHL